MAGQTRPRTGRIPWSFARICSQSNRAPGRGFVTPVQATTKKRIIFKKLERRGSFFQSYSGQSREKGAAPMEHLTVRANGAAFHVARSGKGPALLLLHGWPEYWLTWDPVMTRLAERYTQFAPDLRGFGDSDKPDGPF